MSERLEAPTLSSQLAAKVVAGLIARGVRDFVVCPGSRSQALALACAEAETLGLARLHVRVDERSAAFFALGIARETGLPAPVIVTSGSAVANLMPALLEGHSARVPMILLTADRPAELLGVRANQTTSNNRYTTDFCRLWAHIPAIDEAGSYLNVDVPKIIAEAFEASVTHLNGAGPVHLNISLRDPLSGGSGLLEAELASLQENPVEFEAKKAESIATRAQNVACANVACAKCSQIPDSTETCDHLKAVELDTYVHESDAFAVVIAGSDASSAAEEFAHLAGLPLLAEPSSGARFGRNAIQHWVSLLSESDDKEPTLADMIEQVIVFGNPNLTRQVPALIKRVRGVVIDGAGPDGLKKGIERVNPGHAVETFALAAKVSKDHDTGALKSWLGAWVMRDRQLREQLTTLHQPDTEAATATGYKERSAYARAEVARLRKPITREYLTETLWLATWPHDRLVVASSRLIRVLNRTAAPRNIKVHANRGLAGIDGTISTARAIATASQTRDDPKEAAGTTRLLIGDLAFLHDVGSLALTPGEYQPRLQIIVGNDDGGSIFSQLEVAQTTAPADFERVMVTPQKVEIESLAKAYGWAYRLVETEGELERLFTEPVTGPEIIEVTLS